MSGSVKKIRRVRPFSLSLLAFLFMLSFSFFIVFLDFEERLQSKVESSSEKAIILLEQALRHVDDATKNILLKKVDDCDTSLFILRKDVALVPFLRTLNIGVGNRILCSSFLGPVSVEDDKSKYYQGVLLLMPGNIVEKNHPVIILRREQGAEFALGSIDGLYVKTLLSVAKNNTTLYFNIGQNTLDENGTFYSNQVIPDALVASAKTSSLYPFTVHAIILEKSAFDFFWEWYSITFLGLVIMSLVCSIVVYRLTCKPLSFSHEIEYAISKNQFVPYLQPIVDARNKNVVGVEVLMRWQHPTEGLISPDVFIPQAESSGLIIEMTSDIIHAVVDYMVINKHLFNHGFHVAFNISASHFDNDTIIKDAIEFYERSATYGWQLILELTERMVLVDSDSVKERLHSLRVIGIEIALDDFGTGYSSLTTLQSFKFNAIKIDKSFTAKIGDEDASRYIVDSVITLAKKLGLTLIAEGVENVLQEKYLQEKGVQLLQGFRYSPPLALDDFTKFMEKVSSNNYEVIDS